MGKNAVMTLFCLSILAFWTGFELYMDREAAFEKEECKVTVAAGDTVWGIAGKLYNRQDRYRNFEEFIWNIRKDNGLEGKKLNIQPGKELTINLFKRK